MTRQFNLRARYRRAGVGAAVLMTAVASLGAAPVGALARPPVPGAPVVLETREDYMLLEWAAVEGAVGYNVYDADTREIVQPQADGMTTTATRVAIGELERGSHGYFIKAVGADGSTSWRSGIRVLNISGALPDTICETTLVDDSPYAVTVSLSDNVNAEHGVLTSELYRAIDDSPIATAPAQDALSVRSEDFGREGSVRLHVRYLDANGTVVCWSGPITTQVAQVPARPEAPHKPVVIDLDGGQVTLSFLGDPGSDNASYRLYDAESFQLLYEGTAPSTTLTLPDGHHSVFAKAVDSFGTPSWRSGTQTVLVGNSDDREIQLLELENQVATIEWGGPYGFTQILDCETRAVLKSTHGHRVFLDDIGGATLIVCAITFDENRTPIWTSVPLVVQTGVVEH